MTKAELATYLNISMSEIERNFPKIAVAQMAKGIEICREGVGDKTNYTLIQVTPQVVDKSYFSKRKKNTENIDGEIWTTCLPYPDYEVSDQGRIRHKALKWIQTPDIQDGYARASITRDGKHIRVALHRLVLQSFNPRDDWQEITVDHINGKRADNRLCNLRWAPIEENIAAMTTHRAELNQELTRLIQTFGYEQTLKLLQSL